jgi:hypothetical protein
LHTAIKLSFYTKSVCIVLHHAEDDKA